MKDKRLVKKCQICPKDFKVSLVNLNRGIGKFCSGQCREAFKRKHKRRALNVPGHSDTDRKNSWYWSVLVKQMGTWKKAEQAVNRSRDMVDPTYNLAYRKKIKV